MKKESKESFSIRQVIELTGVSEFTLRGWENRYKAFSPQRTETGRRKYTILDIQKARLLQELVTKGYRIGDIAHLSVPELERWAPTHELSTPPSKSLPKASVISKIIDLANAFRWMEAQDLLRKKRKDLDTIPYITELIVPLIGEVGYLVGQGQFTVAQEHILSALIKDQLILSRVENKKTKSKSKIIMTSPDGDLHDMGLAISSTLSNHEGIHTLFLGPSTPKKDLCETALRYGATHIVLSSTVSEKEGAKESLYSYINFLDRNLPKKVSFVVAGRNTQNFSLQLERKLQVVSSIDEFLKFLSALA